MTIGYYVHHQGQGHRRRATAIARQLTEPVTGLGTGAAPQGWPGAWVELAPDDAPVVGDPALVDVTAGDVLHWVPRHHPGLLKRQRQIVDWLARERPALVVVDVSVEVTLLVRLCGIPVVVGAMPGGRTDAVNALAYDVAEALLAPWPYAAHPDSGWPASWWEKTWHVGGISALAHVGSPVEAASESTASADGASEDAASEDAASEDGSPPGADGRSRRVLVLWGSGGDPLDPAAVERAREATPGWDWTVRGGGFSLAEDLADDLVGADVVVCHAGQGSVADAAWAGRPAVVLGQPRPYEEQDATVHALDRLGLAAIAHGWPPSHRWPALLDQALRLGGEHWPTWGGDGATRAGRLLDDLAGRVGSGG